MPAHTSKQDAALTDWVWPEPSLDEDDRFQVGMVTPEDPNDPCLYFAMVGPSGYGCMYCGGPYDGLIALPAQNSKGKPVRVACCLEHRAFCTAQIKWMQQLD